MAFAQGVADFDMPQGAKTPIENASALGLRRRDGDTGPGRRTDVADGDGVRPEPGKQGPGGMIGVREYTAATTTQSSIIK